ncbi:hypothetical protein [Botrimarina mediterranea]|uniref:Uncharacterized protein n=1 Tax=Botrimarina mediterranea TaxID=2528022 RepID=A0A518K604_9BACT|nr:hypothetical protein [Botrimarina mediterranea]QDV73220.1 hypothetical protein Spa11_14160 [Botrimarina mediterranea]
MADPITERIVRTTDGELVAALVEITRSDAAKEVAQIHLGFVDGEPIRIARSELDEHEIIARLAGKASRVIRSAHLYNGQNQALVSVQRHIVRPANSEVAFYDDLTLNKQHFSGTSEEFIDFAAVVQTRLRSSVSIDLGSLIGTHAKEHFAAREEALNRLELLVGRQNEHLNAQRELLDAQHSKRLAELEESFASRQSDEDETYQQRNSDLDAREKALEERTKEVDDRAATHARRDDRKQLLETIKQADRLKLSPETTWRRGFVVVGYVGLLAFFVAVVVALFRLDPGTGQAASLIILSRIGATVGAIVTAGFFIKWLNDFASRSAAEDFKLKQLHLDVERASWLVELYFESLAAGDKTEFPTELIERLSKNLFVSEEHNPGSVTATDALASALLASAANLQLDLPGAKIDLTKKGLKKMGKTYVSTDDV